jgi:hypothetical protein
MPARNRTRERRRGAPLKALRRQADAERRAARLAYLSTPDGLWDEHRGLTTRHDPDDDCYFGCLHYPAAEVAVEIAAYLASDRN